MGEVDNLSTQKGDAGGSDRLARAETHLKKKKKKKVNISGLRIMLDQVGKKHSVLFLNHVTESQESLGTVYVQ